MIREICKAEVFLAQKAEAATADDLNTAQDLLDTLQPKAHPRFHGRLGHKLQGKSRGNGG